MKSAMTCNEESEIGTPISPKRPIIYAWDRQRGDFVMAVRIVQFSYVVTGVHDECMNKNWKKRLKTLKQGYVQLNIEQL